MIPSDQKRKAQERLEALLLDGLQSGEAQAMTAEDWAELHRRIQRRHRTGGEK